MAVPPHQLHLRLQPPRPPPQYQDQPTIFGNFLSPDGHIRAPIPFLINDQTQSQIPSSFGHDGAGDVGSSGGLMDPAKTTLKVQEFLENSQISSADFLQSRSVSTGLGLSLDDRRAVVSSSVDSPMFPLLGDAIELELQRQEAELDRFLKIQGERLRQAVLEKIQAKQIMTLASIEEKFLNKLREKASMVEDMNKKNLDLEEQINMLNAELSMLQNHAKYNKNMIMALRLNLEKVCAQGKDSKEGCGDSEVDDTASYCNHSGTNSSLMLKENHILKKCMTCKVCEESDACMLLLPCRHLCLCKDCESKISICPLCQSSKIIGMEIYM